MTHETRCIFCQQSVALKLIETPQPVRAWRVYDCPQCLRTNFLVLWAQISTVVRDDGAETVAVGVAPPQVADATSGHLH